MTPGRSVSNLSWSAPVDKNQPPRQGLRPPLDPADLRLPEGMRFSCHQSGRCCEDFWEIPLDGASFERLKSLPLETISPRFAELAGYTEPACGRKGALGLRRVEGRCVFLDPDRRCLIHSRFGPAAKPQACLDFPFRYVCTPRGVFVGLSLVCPSVRAGRGRPLEEQRAEIAANFARSLSVSTVPERVELSPGLDLEFEIYEQVEECLYRLLELETLSLDDRLGAGYVFLQLLDRAVRELGAEGEASAQTSRLIEVFRADEFRRVTTIARKARGSARVHRALLGLLITYRSAFGERRRGRLGQAGYLLYQYFRGLGGLGSLAMVPIRGRVAFRRLRGVRAEWSRPDFVEQIGLFCRHSIFRKDLVLSGSVLKGYGFLLVFVALIRWYALAYAASRGRGMVGDEDLGSAIEAIEKYYCFHTDFMRLFEDYPLLSWMVDQVLAKPAFAPTMLRPKGP